MNKREATVIMCTPLDLLFIARRLQEQFDESRAGQQVPRIIEYLGKDTEIHFCIDQSACSIRSRASMLGLVSWTLHSLLFKKVNDMKTGQELVDFWRMAVANKWEDQIPTNITTPGLREIIKEHDRMKEALKTVGEGLYSVFGQDEAADLMLFIDRTLSSSQEGD